MSVVFFMAELRGENRFYVMRDAERKNRFALRAYHERRSGATPKQVASNLTHAVRQYPTVRTIFTFYGK